MKPLSIMETLAIIGAVISAILTFYNCIRGSIEVDVTLRNTGIMCVMLCGIFFTCISMAHDKSTNKYVLGFSLGFGFIMLFFVFFGNKIFEKIEEKELCISILEKGKIDYKTFKKLSKEAQITLLHTTKIKAYDEDEEEYYLVENEDDLKFFKCILSKK